MAATLSGKPALSGPAEDRKLKSWPIFCAALALLLAAPRAGAEQVVLHVEGPSGRLEGTLAPGRPGGPHLLIIPGSGPTDRDGNGAGGMRAGIYRLLAEGLAAQGVGSLRIDKRGMFGSAGAAPAPDAVTIADYVADIRAWIALLRAREGLPCLWLAGHSEGGVVALAAAAEPEGICGLILLATPGRPLGQVLRAQLDVALAGMPLREDAFAIITALEAGRRVAEADLPLALQPLFRPSVQGFVISLFAQDPARMLAETRLPALILQGQRDLQVLPADAEALHRANPTARLVLLPDTNHVLKTVVADDRAANIAAYLDPDLPLAPGVLGPILDFIGAPR